MTTEEKAPTIADLRKKLTKKQDVFCQEYLVNGYNKKQAAIKAGYAEANARIQAQQVLQNINVKAYTDAIITDIIESDLVRLKGRVLSEFDSLGFSDIKHILDEDGDIDLSKIKEDGFDSRCIKSVQTDVTTIGAGEGVKISTKTKVLYHDKLKALEILTKYLGIAKDRVEFEDVTDYTDQQKRLKAISEAHEKEINDK